MTSNLCWVKTEVPANNNLSHQLKLALRKSRECPLDCLMTETAIGYLQGLEDAGIKDAKKLIEAIGKYGEIRVFEDWG